MEVSPNLNAGSVNRAPSSQPVGQRTKPEAVGTAFANAEALDEALRSTPDTRPEVVARAKKLVEDVNYPPRETINKIANLLAIHFTSGPEELS